MLLHGNAVVGQSGGPTAAINATLSGVIRGALLAKEQGIINTLYGMRNGIEGFLKENLVDLFEVFEDTDKLKTLEATPAAALGSIQKVYCKPLRCGCYAGITSCGYRPYIRGDGIYRN